MPSANRTFRLPASNQSNDAGRLRGLLPSLVLLALWVVASGCGTAADAPRLKTIVNGAFRPVEQFPDLHIRGMGAAWGDYDGDGWLDLAVTGYRTLLLFHNDAGRLEPGPVLPAPERLLVRGLLGRLRQRP